jgi:hypothetical protein
LFAFYLSNFGRMNAVYGAFGATCVFVAGTPLDEPGNTNLFEMKRVE